MTITWDDLLDDFEDLVEQVQHAVDLGEWETRELPVLNLLAPEAEPSAEQATRLGELLAEAAGLQDEVSELQRGVRDELHSGRRAATASRTYLSTNA